MERLRRKMMKASAHKLQLLAKKIRDAGQQVQELP